MAHTKHSLASSSASSTAAASLGMRLVWVMLLRVGLISVLLGATLAFNYQDGSPFLGASSRFLLSAIAVVYGLTILYGIWYRTGRRHALLARVQLAADLVLWSSLSYATGGIASGFTFLFDLWVVLTAAVLGGRAAFHYAAWSSAALVLVAASLHFGLLVPLPDQLFADLAVKDIVYRLVLNVTALFVVAALVTHLVQRLERTGEGLVAEQAKRADLAVLYTDTVRSLTAGLVITDASGDIVTVNPAGREMLGLGPEPVEGAALLAWLPVAGEQARLTAGLVPRGHDECCRPDGSVVPVEYAVSPLLAADGGQRGSIVVFNDLTQLRRLEDALENSRRLAALGELAASLAHEIRNPLGAVSGSVQMLLSRPDASEEERALGAIVLRELGRMERLVSDMLDYARPSRASRHSIDLTALAREVVMAFAHSAEAHERQIELTVSGRCDVDADGSRIKQVIWNLLRNAAQATQQGGHIAVRVRSEAGEAILEVEDDGPGIPEAAREQVFEPFHTSRERGIGLGLAVCRRIVVEEHRGKIAVLDASKGSGALMQVVLPAGSHEPAGVSSVAGG